MNRFAVFIETVVRPTQAGDPRDKPFQQRTAAQTIQPVDALFIFLSTLALGKTSASTCAQTHTKKCAARGLAHLIRDPAIHTH